MPSTETSNTRDNVSAGHVCVCWQFLLLFLWVFVHLLCWIHTFGVSVGWLGRWSVYAYIAGLPTQSKPTTHTAVTYILY
jgi:hypothetical protein